MTSRLNDLNPCNMQCRVSRSKKHIRQGAKALTRQRFISRAEQYSSEYWDSREVGGPVAQQDMTAVGQSAGVCLMGGGGISKLGLEGTGKPPTVQVTVKLLQQPLNGVGGDHGALG